MAENENKKQEKAKIIADDDWKSQAKAEKEKLAKEVESKQAAAAQGKGGTGQQRELPPASFTSLVNFLGAQIMFALGGMQDPKSQKRYVDLNLAKHYIDTLEVLEEKTKGNLSDEEKQLLDRILYETRMNYVQLAQQM